MLAVRTTWLAAVLVAHGWVLGCSGSRNHAPAESGSAGGAGAASIAGASSPAPGAAGTSAPGSPAGGGGNAGASRNPDASVPDPDADADADAGASPEADAGAPREPVRVPHPEPSGCISQVTPGAHVFDCDGLSHDVSVPEACIDTQCGLIIDVHGGTMNAKMEDNNTNLAALGREHGYVVLQPNAFAGLFNADTDDAKVLAMAELLIAVFHLDPDHVHMTGFSQGGYMTWRFICGHTEFLASAAPAAASGAANLSVEVDCSFSGADVPPRALDILYMHGTADALVNFENGVAKRDAVVAHYGLGAGELVASGDGYRRTRYPSSGGTVFEFIEHDYVSPSAVGVPPLGVAIAGHCYPGSMDLTPTEPGQLMAFGCAPENGFVWGEAVLEFFIAHPRR